MLSHSVMILLCLVPLQLVTYTAVLGIIAAAAGCSLTMMKATRFLAKTFSDCEKQSALNKLNLKTGFVFLSPQINIPLVNTVFLSLQLQLQIASTG